MYPPHESLETTFELYLNEHLNERASGQEELAPPDVTKIFIRLCSVVDPEININNPTQLDREDIGLTALRFVRTLADLGDTTVSATQQLDARSPRFRKNVLERHLKRQVEDSLDGLNPLGIDPTNAQQVQLDTEHKYIKLVDTYGRYFPEAILMRQLCQSLHDKKLNQAALCARDALIAMGMAIDDKIKEQITQKMAAEQQ